MVMTFGWAVGIAVLSAIWPRPASACLVFIEPSVAAFDFQLAVRPVGTHLVCVDVRVALNGPNTNRAQYGPVTSDQVLRRGVKQPKPMRPADDPFDLGLDARMLKFAREALGPETIESLRQFYKSIHPGNDVRARRPEATARSETARDETARDEAVNTDDDPADIRPGPSPPKAVEFNDAIRSDVVAAAVLDAADGDQMISADGDVSDSGLKSIPPDAANLYNAIRSGGDIATPRHEDAAVGPDGEVAADLVFQAGTIQVTNSYDASRFDPLVAGPGPGATNNYGPADMALQTNLITTPGYRRASGGKSGDETGGRSNDLFAALQRFLDSSDALAYFIIALIAIVGLQGLRKLIGILR